MGYSYSAPQWLLVFFLYCVLGWCFESTVVSVKQRHFVNRGFLRGPMLPIYGFGAVLLLHVSLPLYDRPAALFFASMAAATVFEYIVGVVMEKLFKVKYWDYSEHRFQFRGYICLQSSLCWGFLGLILARFIHRPVEWVIAALPFRALLAVDVLWSAAFLADVIVSVRAALDLARVLEELDRLREQGAELRQELSETALTRLTNLSYRVEEAAGELAERTRDAREEAQARTAAAAMRAADLREDIEQRLDEAKDELAERTRDAREEAASRRAAAARHAADVREDIQNRLDELQRRFDERASRLSRTRRSLLRGNPTARSAQYDAVLQKLKKHLERRNHGNRMLKLHKMHEVMQKAPAHECCFVSFSLAKIPVSGVY